MIIARLNLWRRLPCTRSWDRRPRLLGSRPEHPSRRDQKKGTTSDQRVPRLHGNAIRVRTVPLRDSKPKGLESASVAAAQGEQFSYPAIKAMIASEDFREGPMAFAQKRKPDWKGK